MKWYEHVIHKVNAHVFAEVHAEGLPCFVSVGSD